MLIATHQAEQCLNELSTCASPWHDKVRFEIIKRHMEAFARQDARVAALEAELESEREANSILTGEVEALQLELEKLQRGEYICRKCGLRKDADSAPGAPEF